MLPALKSSLALMLTLSVAFAVMSDSAPPPANRPAAARLTVSVVFSVL